MEVHTPDVVGELLVAGSPGLLGQVLTSAGPAMQVTWSTPTDNSFTFTSPLSLSHIINHNLNNAYPSITVWDTGTSEVIVPAVITSNSVNQLTITFFVAVSIAGTIIG